MSDARYLICKYGLYYAPNSQGYVGIRDLAGRYTLDQVSLEYPNRDSAQQDGIEFIHENDAPEFSPKCWDDVKAKHLQKIRDALQAERDALQARAEAAEAALARAEADLAKAFGALCKFKEFDDLPVYLKRPDIFEIKVRKPILQALAELTGGKDD